MDRAVFPPCCLTWKQTMVGVMKIMATFFKRSCAYTVVFNAPDPAAGHCWPRPPLETPGHSQASLHQSLVGWVLLPPEFWCTQGFVSALQESVSPVLCKFCNEDPVQSKKKKNGFIPGTSLMVQWLRLHAPNVRGLRSIPGQGTRPHMLQLMIPCTSAKKKKSRVLQLRPGAAK